MRRYQPPKYGRHFLFKHSPIEHDLKAIWSAPGIGLVPPEFDDLEGGENELIEDLGNREAITAE